MKRIFLLLLAAALAACGSPKSQDERLPADFFTGELVCTTDSALFRDCATNYTYVVSRTGDFPEVEGKYTGRAGIGRHEPFFLSFRARLVRTGPQWPDSLVIDRVLDYGRSVWCEPDYLLPGIYESSGSTDREMLHMRTDRTFRITHFTPEGETYLDGTWGLASELEVVLNPTGGAAQMQFQALPQQQTLTGNGDTGPQVFRKVFM